MCERESVCVSERDLCLCVREWCCERESVCGERVCV